jgi:hypothetical protein
MTSIFFASVSFPPAMRLLGKTISSIYIWKELQARVAARRLLVVCPDQFYRF